MWLLYQSFYVLLLTIVSPFLLLFRGRQYRESLAIRLGRYSASSPGGLWIHAVSVGEVGVAATLKGIIADSESLTVTTVTTTGQRQARAQFPRAAITYLPLELGFAVDRFLESHRPTALILCEGDLWPLVLSRTRKRKLPIVVVNGRISDRSFRRMRRLRPFLRPVLEPVDAFGVQTEADRQRLIELRVAPGKVKVTGNLKFDSEEPPPAPELEARLKDLAGNRAILLAGSTMSGEEEQIFEAFQALEPGSAFLVLAPRHPERWDRVATLLKEADFDFARRNSAPRARSDREKPDVFLLDSLGELASAYRLADAAFIGGTLVPTGGHNPLEAARFGVPITIGPHMENFRDIAGRFDAAEAWQRVKNAADLAAVWRGWLDRPANAATTGKRGQDVFLENQGALNRTRRLLVDHIPELH